LYALLKVEIIGARTQKDAIKKIPHRSVAIQ